MSTIPDPQLVTAMNPDLNGQQLTLPQLDPLNTKSFFVLKRDGRKESFNSARILLALESAWRAKLGLAADALLPSCAVAKAGRMPAVRDLDACDGILSTGFPVQQRQAKRV